MGAYKKYIDNLEKRKTELVTVLNNKGVTATNDESLETLVPKVNNIQKAKPEQTKTVALSMASGNQTVSPDSGKVLSKVTITKPDTLIPENIKKDITIGGVVGTLESSSSSGGSGAYNIETTDNSDGTQNLIITDATGGGSSETETTTVTFTSNELDNIYGSYMYIDGDNNLIQNNEIYAYSNKNKAAINFPFAVTVKKKSIMFFKYYNNGKIINVLSKNTGVDQYNAHGEIVIPIIDDNIQVKINVE